MVQGSVGVKARRRGAGWLGVLIVMSVLAASAMPANAGATTRH